MSRVSSKQDLSKMFETNPVPVTKPIHVHNTCDEKMKEKINENMNL
jgi:hypothetical protein